jgi:putative inorganic carbon (hco3(-)) transporter
LFVDSRETWQDRLLQGAVVLLPLAVWPGLEHPFSTPKLWLLAGLDVVAAVRWLRRREGAPDWASLLWAAAVALSASVGAFVSLEALLLALLPLPLARLRLENLKPALALGSMAESGIVLLQWSGLDPLQWLGWRPEQFLSPRMRVYGTMGNPDFAAAWLCATLPLQFRGKHPYAGAIQLLAILATGSRVALIAVPVGLGILVFRGGLPRRWWMAAAAAAAALLWLSPARSLKDTAAGRLYLVHVAASGWRDIPLAGSGPGSFPIEFARRQVAWLRQPAHAQAGARFGGALDHAHNDYLEFLIEYGPLGLGAFLALCVRRIAAGLKPGADAVALAGLASLAVIACVDFPFHRPAEWGLFWLFAGMPGHPTPKGALQDARTHP